MLAMFPNGRRGKSAGDTLKVGCQVDQPLGVKLYREVVLSDCPMEAIHAIGSVNTYELIMVSIQLFSCYLRQSFSAQLWTVYDELLELSRIYQRSHNLNEKAVLDRIGMAMVSVHGVNLQ